VAAHEVVIEDDVKDIGRRRFAVFSGNQEVVSAEVEGFEKAASFEGEDD